jgi:hypothetical protein
MRNRFRRKRDGSRCDICGGRTRDDAIANRRHREAGVIRTDVGQRRARHDPLEQRVEPRTVRTRADG